MEMDRRALLQGAATAGLALGLPQAVGAQALAADDPAVRWVVTTQSAPWKDNEGARVRQIQVGEEADVVLVPATRHQTMAGFGACFNEMGWDALLLLSDSDREAAMVEMFGPDGARFTACRMPIGANDFARDWYSYDETADDLALRNFSISRDDTGLVPFIRAARQQQPDLKLWASPWSPPSWMKRNGHYAMAHNQPGWPDNGLPQGSEGKEGEDWFIQDPEYLDAYARYFGKFVDAYKARGIPISMVMPQNEFNSAQPFPSCCWTPEGLARFLPYLGKEMGGRGVEVFFGTLERPDPALFEKVLADPQAGPIVKGLGVQWAGKGALPFIHRTHPDLAVYQTEQECGDGRNDWRYARYAWTLMKLYLRNGANAYQYWNIALEPGGTSRWGWRQNSLLTVDMQTKAATWNHEYWLMKHLSHFVRPGMARIEATSWTGYDDVLAFAGDGRVVAVISNPLSEPSPLKLMLGNRMIELTMPADSFGTVEVAA
jgi:glucosylceramidase